MSDFDKYIRQGEPESKEKAQAWQTAIGLQDVDGLKPSEYLLQTAGRHIEGDITIGDITKKEWVLDGDTVLYSNHELIRQTLDYDFGQEKSVDYPSLDANQALRHICKFVSDIWQIHPFGEGNTRTTAVFTMKYLRTFGFTFDNSVFQEHSWYFRNALVRANYNNYSKGISATISFLELFFRNLLFGEKNELHNRAMHIAASQRANTNASKSQNDTLNCTLDEIALLKFLKDNPNATQTEIAVHIGKSPRTVKRMTPSLIERGLLERENGKRNGKWVVKI